MEKRASETGLHAPHRAKAEVGNSGDVTQIISAIEAGDVRATADLLPLVYDELRRLAAARLATEAPGHTLQATALVHEAYLRLMGPNRGLWGGRGHFFAAAAEAMRRILIDRARAKRGPKRGGDRKRLSLEAADLTVEAVPDEVIDLDAALSKLAREDSVKAELVKLRFFGGMGMEEAARFLGISPTTADRYWAYARAWLYHEMVSGWVDPP
jgi:RNA polymerase sigma factor (TIGR02999 family)